MSKLKIMLPLLTLFSFSVLAEKLNDAHIVEVLSTINEEEIDAAEAAIKQATHPDVKAFARQIAAEHKKSETDLKELVKSQKLSKEDSALSDKIEDDAEAMVKVLKQTENVKFDATYLSQQISMHENALNIIKDQLFPATTNPAMKGHLEKTQASVNTHLQRAKSLQSKIQ